MTIKNNPGLREFLVRLGATVAAVVLVMYLAKVWFVDPRLAVLPAQELASEQVDTTVKAEEEALKSVVKETTPVFQPQPPALPSGVISWKDAAKHYGEHGTVEGTIVDSKGFVMRGGKGTASFLNIGKPYPEPERFTVVIWPEDRSRFPGEPENYYLGKKVHVSGRIGTYKGSPQIILKDPNKIEIVKAGPMVTLVPTAPVKLVIKKVDTDGDGIPDTFILSGEPKKKPVSLAEAKAKEPDLIKQPYLIKATCTRVADGDTITAALSDGSIRNVRLVGIDTPEIWRKTGTGWVEDPERGAKKASKFTKKEVPVGQTVYLDVDDEEPEDHYGRMLALVYTNLSDAKKGPRYSLNAKLLQKDLAEVLFIPPSEFDPYSWK